MDKYIGKRLDGRYEIKEIIGMGGMAVVYKAYDNIEDRVVAVKILKEEFSGNEEFLRRFKNSAFCPCWSVDFRTCCRSRHLAVHFCIICRSCAENNHAAFCGRARKARGQAII